MLYLGCIKFMDLTKILMIHSNFNRLMFKKQIFKCSNGNQLRDFLYIDDLTSVFFKALNNKDIIHKIINVGTAKPKKLKDIIASVIKIFNSVEPKYGVVKLRKDEAKEFTLRLIVLRDY